MKVVAIIQSRLGSTRLPRKAFALIDGRPLIEHVVRRTAQIGGINAVVVATTRLEEDRPLADLCSVLHVPAFRGNGPDVLSRYYRCAIAFEADVIVRITGDCPLLDPISSTLVLGEFLEGDDDYVSNIATGTDGWDTEVMTFRALRRAHRDATDKSDREHVTPYIRSHSDEFRVGHYVPFRIPGNEKWSVDTQEDLERVRAAVKEPRL